MRVLFRRKPGSESNQISVVCLGTFDAVHLGHRALIDAAIQERQQLGSSALVGVISFYPHPRSVLSKGKFLNDLITPLRIRTKIFNKLSVDTLILYRFTESLAKLSPEEFIRDYVVKVFKPKVLVVGFDWRFGKGREGGISQLEAFGKIYGFKTVVVPPLVIDEKKVGASSIRNYLEEGQVEKAKILLGDNFTIFGRVVHGDGRGRQIGFPTANIKVPRQFFPKKGVYISYVNGIRAESLLAVTNIGTRPTFSGELVCRIESHILDFDEDLYGKLIEVELVEFIRGEMKFNSVEELKEQIARDILVTRKFNERV